MKAVKKEYKNRYGVDMQKAVAEGTEGEWGQFCEMLCINGVRDDEKEIIGWKQ